MKSFTKEPVLAEKILPVSGKQFEIEFTIEPGFSSVSGIRIAKQNDQYLEIGYDAAKQVIYIDRSKAGNNRFTENFKKLSRFEKNVTTTRQKIKMRIYFDNSIAEVFVNDGELAFTAQVFSGKDATGIALFSDNSASNFADITFWEMKSVW